ncbi:hypothetical protein LCGC14_1765380 [marine sediment metagenome]|uniref:LamG-like jellyroll fold domain-containing protein n=1 Tax=marine sediment metagenome TaxID=412755 RepID=A0A0F9GZV8_9ZZZZ
MKKYIFIALLILISIAYAQKTSKVIVSFNAGELSPLMDARIDQAKYLAGCRTMVNYIPLIYGGAQRRSGTEFIATQKDQSAKGKVVAFEHSVDDTYILLFENQNIRVFRDGGRVLTATGTEDNTLIDAAGTEVETWLLNDNAASTTVVAVASTTLYGLTVTNDTSVLHADGKVGNGSLDFRGSDAVKINDNPVLSFDDSDDKPMSITSWAYVTDAGVSQTIFSKWKGGTAREYRFYIDANRKLRFDIADDSSMLADNLVAHWKLNDDAANTAVDDDIASVPHDGIASANTNTFNATGKVGTGSLDFGGLRTATVTDNDALSFDDSGSNPFSVAAWVYVTNTGVTQSILSKWDRTTGSEAREWSFRLSSAGKLQLFLHDESVADASSSVITDAALSAGWHFVVAAYDSTGGSTAADGITLYVDKIVVAQTATNNANYVAMENLGGLVYIGAIEDTGGTAGQNFADKLDNIMLFDVELSSTNVDTLWNGGSGTEDADAGFPYCISNSALSTGWRFVSMVYDNADASWSAATAANFITLYVDGSAVTCTAFNETSLYTAMENTAADVYIGSQLDSAAVIENVWRDKIDVTSLFSTALSAANVLSLYSTTNTDITTPYLTSDLFDLKFEQSADVMFITHPNYEPRRLSRTGHTEWNLVVGGYKNGPFRDQNTTLASTISAAEIDGGGVQADASVTLTAAGENNTPFRSGTPTGHLPSGSVATSKSQTGTLFKIVYAVASSTVSANLASNVSSSELSVYKGVTWDFTTNNSSGQNWTGTVKLEREYNNSAV